jgi:hypothetical protein
LFLNAKFFPFSDFYDRQKSSVRGNNELLYNTVYSSVLFQQQLFYKPDEYMFAYKKKTTDETDKRERSTLTTTKS